MADRPRLSAPSSRLPAVAGAGAALSSLAASACCIGPLILALLGVGGAGLLVKFEPYRPLFMVATAALLAAGFFFAYRRAPAASATGVECDCPAPQARRAGKVSLWIATVVVAGFLAFPYLAPYLFG